MFFRCLQFLHRLNQCCAYSYHLPSTLIVPQALKVSIIGLNLAEQWSLFKRPSNTKSHVSFDKEKFQVNLDVSKYKCDDLKVRISGRNKLIIEGVCEEEHEGDCVSNTFIWCYTVPDEYNIGNVATELSSDGVLTLTIPCSEKKDVYEENREIQIVRTGQPK